MLVYVAASEVCWFSGDFDKSHMMGRWEEWAVGWSRISCELKSSVETREGIETVGLVACQKVTACDPVAMPNILNTKI